MKIAKIDIEEFKNKIYLEYISLFPDEEQRDWEDIEYSYNSGIEQFYKIVFENDIIGFIILIICLICSRHRAPPFHIVSYYITVCKFSCPNVYPSTIKRYKN